LERDVVHITTDVEVAVLHRLTGWALEHGYSLDGLVVTRPTLEDVYLRLTKSDPVADEVVA
jgi:ABC-2 type transport system ATP-binding protein